MANDLRSYTIPNLVQGVSQQVSTQRRETQAEAQFDCVNSPVNGCEARPPVEVFGFIPGARYGYAGCHEIARGNTEDYLAIITNDVAEGDKRLRVFDLVSGVECNITRTANEDYITSSYDARDWFRAATLEDYTFVAARGVLAAMDPANKSPAPYNEAVMYFKAGGYAVKFQVTITYAGKTYVYTYVTPDNSTVANAPYITTNNLAATFFRALTNGAAVPKTDNTTAVAGPSRTAGATSNGSGVGAADVGDTSVGSVSAGTPLTSLGFYVAINGNCLLIGRADSAPFSIDTSDGVGDTYLRSFKEQVQSFADLPKACFVGVTAKVKGTNKQSDDDYWVTFKGADGQNGYWEETAKPDTVKGVNAATFPHALINTGYQTFEWKRPAWGERVAGDGVEKSQDPSFIGKPIWDIFYANARLGILTEGSVIYSKNRNPYVFFPLSAQTIVDTDPIDNVVGGGTAIALLRWSVQINDFTYLWASRSQFKMDPNQDKFTQENVEARRSTSYSIAEQVRPHPVGSSLYIASEPGAWANIRDVTYQEGRHIGDTDVTAHVAKYIPKGVRILTGSDTLGSLFVLTDGADSWLYLYNFLLSDRERLQSAWNIWRLPSGCKIVWGAIRDNYLNLLVQRGNWGALLCRVDLTRDVTDPGFSDYQTRVDLRLAEGQLQARTYDAETDTTKLYLPFPVAEAHGNPSAMYVVTRIEGASLRGQAWDISEIAHDAVLGYDYITVRGDATAEYLYVGFRITAEREESEFFVRTQGGAMDIERLSVREHIYSFAKTGYFRAIVTDKERNEFSREVFGGRMFGDPANKLGLNPITDGKLTVGINRESTEYRCVLVNDSFLPSRWTSCAIHYTASVVATPQATKAGTTGGR